MVAIAKAKSRKRPKSKGPAAQPTLAQQQQRTIDAFHRLYYDSTAYWDGITWFGAPMAKCPMDLWIYQEIIYETKPDLIVECGTFLGGSALYLANILTFVVPDPRVVSIDIDKRDSLPVWEGLSFLQGKSSVDASVVATVAEMAAGRRTMVILDSDHHRDHVYAELEAYGPLVSQGCYLIVEDGNVNGNPIKPEWGPGPTEAIADWLPSHPEYTMDRKRERLLLSMNPGGFLRRDAA